MNHIHYVTAPCGAHKTTEALHEIGQFARRGYNYILAQPTKALVDASYEKFKQQYSGVKSSKIHRDSLHGESNVSREIEAITKQAVEEPGWTIFCTHSGLMQTPYVFDKENWHVIYDETPSPIWNGKLDLKRNHHARGVPILSGLDAYPVGENGYQKLTCSDRSYLDNIASDPVANLYSHELKDFCKKMLSGFWDFYVLPEQWKKAKAGDKKDGDLLLFGLLDTAMFEGYASMNIMSANFKNTLLAKFMENNNVSLKPHKRITNKLAFHTHENGELLTIYYAIPQKWSKRLRDAKFQVDGVETNRNKVIAEAAMLLFGDEMFLKQVNKDNRANDPFGEKGEMLPFKAYGLNTYMHVHNAVILPALNLTPACYRFLEETTGIDKDVIHHAIYCEEIYQTVVRGSMRNPLDLNPKKAVVADEKAALFLHQMFPGSKVELLPCVDKIPFAKKAGRGQMYSPAEAVVARNRNNALYRKRAKWKAENGVKIANIAPECSYQDSPTYKLLNSLNPDMRDKAICCESDLSATTSTTQTNPLPQKGFSVSFWDSRATGWRPFDLWEVEYHKNLIGQHSFTAEEFFEYLRLKANTVQVNNKHHNNLFIPAHFDLNKDTEHGHSKSNHTVSQGVVLDIDGGELTPEQIHQVLPFNSCAYSSWSHSPADLRYRLAFPTDPMTYDANEAIRRMCVRKIEEAFPDKKHGVDMSKMTSVAMFFLPSVRSDGFFKLFEGEDFDHRSWIKDCPPDIIDRCMMTSPNTPPPEPDEIAEPTNLNAALAAKSDPRFHAINSDQATAMVDRLIQTFQERGTSKGNGHAQLWSLSKSLAEKTNLSDEEIRTILEQQANFAHNPGERKDEIPALIKSLRSEKQR